MNSESGCNSERSLLERASQGDAAALRSLVQQIAPVVQARAARIMLRSKSRLGRDVRQDVEDLTQEVLVGLLADNLRVLKNWEPSRGLSLRGFVGLVAERQVVSTLRNGRRSPFRDRPVAVEDLDSGPSSESAGPFAISSSREFVRLLLERLQESLTPLGLEMFHRLYVKQESVDEVCLHTGMQEQAVYAWKSRLGKMARRLLDELELSKRPPYRAMTMLREERSHG